MKKPALIFASAFAAAALAPASLADGLNAGSALVYPIHDSTLGEGADDAAYTVLNVTNTNLNPVDGDTNVHFEYVNLVKDSHGKIVDCMIVNRIEGLTPADTLSVLTNCHNAASGQQGYVVVSAQDPSQFSTAWSHNYLVGSELVVRSNGLLYSVNAMPFASLQEEGAETDLDADGELDFDGVEYEGIADYLILDSFLAAAPSSLILINLTGGSAFDAVVAFDIFNDDEFPLSATLQFRCWIEAQLEEISLVFTHEFLNLQTPNDYRELDIDCDMKGDLETGWARIRGVVANSAVESIADPALLGIIATNSLTSGGRRLWESEAKQLNGDFAKFGADDPEN